MRNHERMGVLALAAVLGMANLGSTATFFVKSTSQGGSNTNSGSSWVLAKATVQAGLNAAVSGDQVWVMAGIYNEQITLKDGVALYGGFAGTETDLSQRNFRANVTILDGQQGGSVVTSPSGATASTRIDGFTIRNGNGTLYSTIRNGGGIYCSYSSPTISNNTISGNGNSSYGGGIYCDHSYAIIVDNTISNNTASSSGGGIYCGDCSPTIRNNTISGNNGGGIYCYFAHPRVHNNVIRGNGGSTGGGIFCYDSSPVIQNNTIIGNSGAPGGGLYMDYSSPVITNNIIAFNGTGIYKGSGDGAPVLHNNCVFNPGGANYTNLSAGTGDMSEDPRLEAPAYGKYHLNGDSPCINVGNDADVQSGQADIDGQARTVGAHVDIGADEYNGTVYAFTPAIIRVSSSGHDANDGSSWTLAKRTVGAAIDAAAAVGGDVWVAEGTYNERIALKSFAYLFGGFAGTETQRDHRNFRTHVTVLDGQQGGSVVTARLCGYQVGQIDGFVVQNGRASMGGGFYCRYSSPIISNNTIRQNTAINFGAGICCDSSCSVIRGNIISGNSAPYGSGIFCRASFSAITNNTITGNSGTYGSGIYCMFLSPVIIANNIIAFNDSGIVKTTNNGEFTLLNNCVFNPAGSDYAGCSPGQGDISADPVFVDRVGGDFHLAPQSPCLDAGHDASVQSMWRDVDNQPRISGDHVDIGADEYFVLGDANGDSAVNFSDYLLLSQNFGATESAWEQGDFNNDSTVNFSDYLVLSSNFGASGAGADIPTADGETATISAEDLTTATLPCAPMGLVVLMGLGLGELMLVRGRE